MANNFFASISPSSDSLSSASLSFQQQQQILQSASQSFVDTYPPSKMSSNAVGSALQTSSTNLPSSINQLGLWPELPDVAHSHVSSSTNASFVDPPFFPSPGVDLRASYTSPPDAFPSHHQQISDRQLPLPISKESLKGKGRELAPLSELQAEGGRGGYWDQGLEKGLRGAAVSLFLATYSLDCCLGGLTAFDGKSSVWFQRRLRACHQAREGVQEVVEPCQGQVSDP